jgi:hypothetical protein
MFRFKKIDNQSQGRVQKGGGGELINALYNSMFRFKKIDNQSQGMV